MEQLRQKLLEKLFTRSQLKNGTRIDFFQHMIDRAHDLAPKKKSKDRPREQSAEELEKEATMKKLCNLFLNNKASLVTPCVPDMVYYMTKSAQKTDRIMKRKAAIKIQQQQRKFEEKKESVNLEGRLMKARRASKRRPRSRRELAKLSLAQPISFYNDNLGGSGATRANTPQFYQPPRTARESPSQEDGERIFKMTEPQISEDDMHNSHLRSPSPKAQLELSQPRRSAQVLYSALERMPPGGGGPLQSIMRPKSAPLHNWADSHSDGEHELEYFDFDTGDLALTALEHKMRVFHQSHGAEDNHWKDNYRVVPLKRFTIDVSMDYFTSI